MAVDLGTGFVGSVIDVVLCDVEGIIILGGAALGSSLNCLVVLISISVMGYVGNCTRGIGGEEGDIGTLKT